ncbi:transposable element Tcb2 transposase [Trichonephila clavipes]|nr:transposable element Tcb2 transposase [Trichonephila clavipes]
MDVCKCIGLLRHEGTLNSRRAASPLVWLVEGKERWEALTTPGFSPSKFGWNLAREHRACQADWHQIVFSDESRFNLWDHDVRIRVRHMPVNAAFHRSNSRSYEMSRTEHVWDSVGWRFVRDPRPTASKDELLLRIQAIWNFLPQTDIQNLFESMPGRIATLIATRGGYTKY